MRTFPQHFHTRHMKQQYRYELTDEDHLELLAVLKAHRGEPHRDRSAGSRWGEEGQRSERAFGKAGSEGYGACPDEISGYASDLYDQELAGWYRETTTATNQTSRVRQEVLWMNFDPDGQGRWF